jgi:sugar phosphate isomerase/epimerase
MNIRKHEGHSRTDRGEIVEQGAEKAAVVTLSAFADEISPVLEQAMDLLAGMGISHIDLRTAAGTNVLQLSDQDVAHIKRRLDARGFQVASIASPIGAIGQENPSGNTKTK